MSHYTLNYEGMAPEEKRATAVQDIRDYLGPDEYARIEGILKSWEPLTLRQLEQSLALFVGISGYPVLAWHETLWPDRDDLRKEDA